MGRTSNARERLLEAATLAFFGHSYVSVSVDELCSSAGVTKSSFYHFFSSKQDLILTTLESHWQRFEQNVLSQVFMSELPPQERILSFFDLTMEQQQIKKQLNGHMRGCPAGNMAIEMSTQDELIRAKVESIFHRWLQYFENMLRDAKQQGIVPATLDTATTAQALLAYYEGVMLLAKSRNDPTLISTLRAGVLSLMQYQGERIL
jgi:TetR/AcrR family transcriptional repressor of nem operon